MSLHALYVNRLAHELKSRLKGMQLTHLYSLDRRQLFFHFSDNAHSFQFGFRIEQEACYFSFPDHLSTAVPNRYDRFLRFTGMKVRDVKPHPMERSFQLDFENGSLVFYCHGRNAQVVAVYENETETFRASSLSDAEEIEKLNGVAGKTWELERADSSLFSHSQLKDEISNHGGNVRDWFNAYLEGPVYLNKSKGGYVLSPWKGYECLADYITLWEALDHWGRLESGRVHFFNTKRLLIRQTEKEIKSLELRLNSISKEKEKLAKTKNYRHLGDLILANLYQIQPGAESCTVTDYLDGKSLEIRLQASLSPQENAQRYYRKAKNQHREIQKLEAEERPLEERLPALTVQLQELIATDNMKELRPFLKEEKQREKKQERLPYRDFRFMGYVVLVGRQAADNDELTLKYAKKDDLWLHARDVAGSHVVIKKKAGESFPDAVINYACGLALWFSKRKNEALAPVTVTEKKHVRKRKGDPAGMVTVDRETVRMASPVKPE